MKKILSGIFDFFGGIILGALFIGFTFFVVSLGTTVTICVMALLGFIFCGLIAYDLLTDLKGSGHDY